MNFATRIIHWQREFGRHDLPWQKTHDPYRIWLSEIMLQQTQVKTVMIYYEQFLLRYPTVDALARADHDDVMALWAGLGYYARARNLHQCAKIVSDQFQGQFPSDTQTLASLPGIGPSTASAIAAFAFGRRSPILDGNVKRVFARHFAIEGDVTKSAVDKQLWRIAYDVLPVESEWIHQDMIAYTQGLMDLGAGPCKKADPQCFVCPVQGTCIALKEGRQAELPSPKARKQLPVKQTNMLLIDNGHGSILVAQRPNQGIWGGLWSLPEFSDEDLTRHTTLLSISTQNLELFAEFRHTFSHYHLDIKVWLGKAQVNRLHDTGFKWLALAEPFSLGLPRPVQTILKNYLHQI